MNLKRLKAAAAELSACIAEMEGEDEPEAKDEDDEEGEDAPPADTLKMKLMKFKPA